MTNDHPAQLSAEQLLSECEVRRQRRSGPGGQHRNKVETGIFLRHRPTGIEVSATERRGQEANRLVAIHRLRIALAIEYRQSRTEPYTVSALWQKRRQGDRIRVNVEHDDYPALLAEALDLLQIDELDLGKTAERLSITASQLLKFIQAHPQALTQLNRQRIALGLHPLKP
jgi:hypothetical protein